MASYAGYISVTTEYNGSFPNGLKNALDYLYNELTSKPAIVISYGIVGGETSNACIFYQLADSKTQSHAH